jgi:hypothetical protein
LTADVDLVVDLDPVPAAALLRSLARMGFAPRAPVQLQDFANPAERRRWIDERGMVVFNVYDPRDPLRSIDLFVEPPLPFEELWAQSVVIPLPAVDIRVASIDDLIEMKRRTGRPEDVADIAALEELRDG